ncbi:MAG TPA: CoA-binding protein [Porticoccaceae bacterium]|nr:CoA-binding protein [Porticoccaceae bacterium]HIG67072.1 CoA-binding protein [Porticoccaceae bacterium]
MLDNSGAVLYNDHYEEAYLKQILTDVKNIALIGASPKPERDSYLTMEALLKAGYTVFPVNPFEVGNSILGQLCYAAVTDIPHKIDMVDIFRSSEFVLSITDDAIASGAQVVWMQLGVINLEARDNAIKASLKVVMNRCPKQELAKPYWTDTLS